MELSLAFKYLHLEVLISFIGCIEMIRVRIGFCSQTFSNQIMPYFMQYIKNYFFNIPTLFRSTLANSKKASSVLIKNIEKNKKLLPHVFLVGPTRRIEFINMTCPFSLKVS